MDTPHDTPEILAFDPERRTNARLVSDLAVLGWLRRSDSVWDVTYGQGRWWKEWLPTHGRLLGSDLDPACCLNLPPTDFTALPDNLVAQVRADVIVYDPPYKLNGRPTGRGPATSDTGYGVGEYVDWRARMSLMRRGLREACRVSGRVVIAKCQDQVVSGRKVWQTVQLTRVAQEAGWRLADQLHVVGMRAQPGGRNQAHARQNYSTALVFARA